MGSCPRVVRGRNPDNRFLAVAAQLGHFRCITTSPFNVSKAKSGPPPLMLPSVRPSRDLDDSRLKSLEVEPLGALTRRCAFVSAGRVTSILPLSEVRDIGMPCATRFIRTVRLPFSECATTEPETPVT